MPQPVLQVSVAIITDMSGRLLVTQRPHDISYGGFWELPGGKIEPNETPAEALLREIHEEVGLTVTAADLIKKVTHVYPEKIICLHVFQVKHYIGEAGCCDGQLDLRWILWDTLHQYQFLEATDVILHTLLRTLH